MTDDLTTLLHDAGDKERRRFAAEHPGAESSLYERAIVPRRVWRRTVEAAGALAVVAVIGFGVNAFVRAHEVEPAPPVPTVDQLDRAWKVNGATRDATGSVQSLQQASGNALIGMPGCAALDTVAILDGGSDRGPAIALGTLGFLNEDVANGIHVRQFADAQAASDLLDEVVASAERCGDEAAEQGVAVEVARGGLTVAPGEGVRVVVTLPGEESGSWNLRVHTAGDVGIAVVTEPGATDLSADATIAFLAAEPRVSS